VKRKSAEWFNDDRFWEQYAPVIFDEGRWAEVPVVAEAVVRLGRLTPRAQGMIKILDLCCGFGRISAELGRNGFSVTGVDITESYLKTAREDAAYENLAVEYVRADVRDFVRPEYFDIAVNLYVSFGYFENQNDDKALLKNAYNSLKRGGSFVMEALGKEIAVRDFIEADWFERAGFTVLTEFESLDSWTFLKNKWILIKNDTRVEKVFIQRLYAASELRALLLETGFSAVEIYGDWDERPYDRLAEKLIVVGRK
jgi:SAM-dependent methyltransferase